VTNCVFCLVFFFKCKAKWVSIEWVGGAVYEHYWKITLVWYILTMIYNHVKASVVTLHVDTCTMCEPLWIIKSFISAECVNS